MLKYQFRPIDRWPLPERTRRNSQFKARWSDTLDLLESELRHLSANEVVIQADVTLAMIRNDGMLRAEAKPYSPRVILSFESKHGPKSIPCDCFLTMHANIRAIALGLEALRRVDRYGITQTGEQYRGWERLEGPTSMSMTVSQAAGVLLKFGGNGATQVTRDRLDAIYRAACAATHPDAGGNAEDFKRVQRAKEIVDAHYAGRAT